MIIQFGGTVERGAGVGGGRVRLLELSDGNLMEVIQAGGRLKMKGTGQDEVILCSDQRTFRVREIHTSNTHMLVGREGKVRELSKNLLEAKMIPAKVERLRELLEACPYEGPDERPEQSSLQKLEISRLLDSVQGSDEELKATLLDYGAIIVDGYYRLPSSEYLCRFFKLLFSLLTMADLDINGDLTKQSILELFSEEQEEFPTNTIEQLLNVYANKVSSDELLHFNDRRICRFYAEELLKARPVWIYTEFLDAWRQLTIDIQPRMEFLAGLVLEGTVPGEADQRRITYFPAASLPVDIVARFGRLFEANPRWELVKIRPFVEGIATALNVDLLDLIVKHARISVDPSGKEIVTPLLGGIE